MRELIEKYAVKMFRAGLAHYGAPLFGGLDADLVWNRPDPRCGELEAGIQGLSVNSLLFCRPAEPYASIVEFLARQALDEAGNQPAAIQPQDCETRTFLHDLPVIRAFSVPDIIQNLKRRKTVIIPGEGIVTWGTVSPEQAYIFFSSACFACFVRFFTQYLTHYRRGTLTPEHLLVFERAMATLDTVPLPRGGALPDLMTGPFENEEAVYAAIAQAGRATVDYQLVDSFFGNVSYLYDTTLYISQPTSSLAARASGLSCTGIPSSRSFFRWIAITGTAPCGDSVWRYVPRNASSATFPLCPARWEPARGGYATRFPLRWRDAAAESSMGTVCSRSARRISARRLQTCSISNRPVGARI